MTSGPKTEIVSGGQGGGALIDPHHVREHLNMMRRAAIQGSLTPEQQRDIREAALKLVETADSERDKAAALRVLAALERNDMERIKILLKAATDAQPTTHQHLHLHGNVDPRDMSDEDLDAYIAEQRSRIAGESRSGTES